MLQKLSATNLVSMTTHPSEPCVTDERSAMHNVPLFSQ